MVNPLIKELRVFGALGAVDYGNEELNMRIIKSCLENGIISDWFLFCTTAMRIAPPLTISDQELIEALQKIKMILDAI